MLGSNPSAAPAADIEGANIHLASRTIREPFGITTNATNSTAQPPIGCVLFNPRHHVGAEPEQRSQYEKSLYSHRTRF